MQDDAVKDTVAEIPKHAMSKKRVRKDMLTDPDLTETTATTVDTRVQRMMEQKLVAGGCVNI